MEQNFPSTKHKSDKTLENFREGITSVHLKAFFLHKIVYDLRQNSEKLTAINIGSTSRLSLSDPTVIKDKLLLSSDEQLWAVQYGEVGR